MALSSHRGERHQASHTRCWVLPRPPTQAPPPTEPCQAPPSSCTHTQHDTGRVTCTQHSASERQAGRLPTHRRGWRGRDRQEHLPCHGQAGSTPGTHSAGTVQRRLRGHKEQPAQVIHRQMAQEALLRRLRVHRHEKAPAPHMPPALRCACRRSAHVDTHRCTQTLTTRAHTPLLSDAFTHAHTQLPTPSPSTRPERVQTPIT